MPDKNLKELKKHAIQIGLTKLTDAHLAQLDRATAGSRRRKAQMPDDIHFYDEPAYINRASEEA